MASGANASDRSRLEQARLKLQKTAARRRVEQKANRNKRQRRAYQRKQKVEKKVEGVKGLGAAAGDVAGTAPGVGVVKKGAKITKSLAGTVAGAVAGAAGSGDGTLREKLQEHASGVIQSSNSSAPIELEHGYEHQENGNPLGWYRAGSNGQKYYYVPGNEASRAQAKKQARAQMPPPGQRGGSLPSLRELSGHAGVDESFMTMGLRAEFDPMPPVKGRQGQEPLPTVGGTAFTGNVGFDWGGAGSMAASSEETDEGGIGFHWGEEAGESDSSDPFAGFDGGFSWGSGEESGEKPTKKDRDDGGWSW